MRIRSPFPTLNNDTLYGNFQQDQSRCNGEKTIGRIRAVGFYPSPRLSSQRLTKTKFPFSLIAINRYAANLNSTNKNRRVVLENLAKATLNVRTRQVGILCLNVYNIWMVRHVTVSFLPLILGVKMLGGGGGSAFST